MDAQSTPNEAQSRLFAAIQLPEAWLEALDRVRADLAKTAAGELRWVRPELMHITLLFLGNVPADLLPDAESCMATAAARSHRFRLELGRLGSFGPPNLLTVLWAGLTETPPELQQLHAALAEEMAEKRVPFDRKPLVPHVTLARGKRPIDRSVSLRVFAALSRLQLPIGLSAPVADFVLMRSQLSPKGPTYGIVRSFDLGGSTSGQ